MRWYNERPFSFDKAPADKVPLRQDEALDVIETFDLRNLADRRAPPRLYQRQSKRFGAFVSALFELCKHKQGTHFEKTYGAFENINVELQ